MGDWVPGRHTWRKVLSEGSGSVKQLAARNERAASFCVSSPKSVGEFGFREIAETAIQGDFNGFVGPKTIGFSGGQFHFVVEPGSYPSAFICFASLARTSSIDLFIFCMMWKRSRTGNPMFYRAKHVLPAHSERFGAPFLRAPLRPVSQEPARGRRQRILAVTPRELLHLHTARRPLNFPHGINEENRNLPQRHKFKSPRWLPIVAGSGPLAFRTVGATVGSRDDRNLDLGLGFRICPARFLVNV